MLSRFHLIPERYRWTDGQTGLLYQYRASVCWRAIKTVESANSHVEAYSAQQYQQFCHLANGNKTCCSLLLFKNNKLSRGPQGFVRQSSRNVALHVEQPSVLNKFFFRITIFCRVQSWEQKVCGWDLKIRQISSLFGLPCRLRMTRKKSK